MKILVTGGAGFIGSHLVDRLIDDGHEVRVYDILEEQVHQGENPTYLNKEAEYIWGDIRDKNKLKEALEGVEIIFHEAAQVGVAQSMYEIEKYISHNSVGTAVLLDLLVNTENEIRKLIVASSMSIYGEGSYKCENCGIVYPTLRSERQLTSRVWEMLCPGCNEKTTPLHTPENKPLFPSSVYATSKRSQEEMCLEVGRAYKIPTVALRYFNVFGPRQSLNNPYTGVAAIFLSRVKNNNNPLIFEDGKQSRDFIYVSDIIQANMLAMEKDEADYEFFNVGTGNPKTILDIADSIISLCGKEDELRAEVLSKFRAGDIRHCFADITKISNKLGFKPQISFEEGMKKLIEWSETQEAKDLTSVAQEELKSKGLAE